MKADLSKANLVDIYTTIQGEGQFAGRPHLLVRLSGCNLSCSYCDTPDSREKNHGVPVSCRQLIERIVRLNEVSHHAICLTGGEPLINAEFLADFLRLYKDGKHGDLPILLETNGTLPFELEKVIDLLDIVSMDIKLPSTVNGQDLFDLHVRFLNIAVVKHVYVKIVILDQTDINEFMRAVDLVSAVDREIPFYIQPVTPYGRIARSPSSDELMEMLRRASKILESTYIMPQIHISLNIK